MQNLHYFISTEIPHDISFFVSNYSKLKNVMRLRGFPCEVKAEVVKKVAERAAERGSLSQIIHESIDYRIEEDKPLERFVENSSRNTKKC